MRIQAADLAGQPRLLSQLGFDHISADPSRGAVELAADPEQLAALDRRHVPYQVLIDDLASWYASRLTSGPDSLGQFGAWLSPPFATGSMGGYYTYAEITSLLDQIHAAYPTLTTAKASLGSSIEGRSMWMLKISDNASVDENEPEVRIDALHHAREPEGMQASLWFVLYLLESYATDPLAKYLVDNRELYYIPCVNPDGYVYNQTTNPGGGGMWRKNRRINGGGTFGVDLNRNYNDHWGWDDTGSSPSSSSDTYRGTAPASEPEIQAMQAFIQSRQFQTSLSVHTYQNLWLYPFGYAQVYPANDAQYVEVATLATEVNHYEVGPPAFILYLANGVTADYDHDAKGTLAFSPEIGSSSDGFWPPTNRIVPLAEENLLGLQRTTLAAGAWLRVLSSARTDAGDGDGYFEAGESVQFTATVRNSGRAASGSAIYTLATSSPYATVTNGSHVFGSIGTFSQANSAALSLAIAPNAPGGVAIDYTLTLDYEGWNQVENGTLAVGQPIPFVLDDAESDLGWTMGIAGDTATSGLWTRGVPIGTNSSGQPASPSVDNTPAPGTRCYLTGNGGGSAGTDDVDGGATTLISPQIDLSNCGPARVRFARWFADLTVADDIFAISISNNGGASWTALENVNGNANAWTSVGFELASVLPQTASMRLRFVASDSPNNSVVEAAVDDLRIEIFDAAPRLNLYGKRTAGPSTLANITGPAGAGFVLRATLDDPNSGPIPPASTGRARVIATGTIPASQLASVVVTVPSGANWIGKTIWFRATTFVGTVKTPTNWASIVVQ